MGYLLGILATYALLVIGYYVFYAVACWRIFAKAGEAGWKALIPFLNSYTLYKISWKTTMFWVFLGLAVVMSICNGMNGQEQTNTMVALLGGAAGIASTVVSIMCSIKTSKAFGKGIGFAIGMVILRPIFLMILGLGSAEYEGPQE